MTSLSKQHCEACRADAPLATAQEKAQLSQDIPHWRITEVAGEEQLHRRFDFASFAEALAFTNRVGELAETEGHHPALTTEWGKVTVAWWTHKIKGLHRNDFIMAEKTDALYDSQAVSND